nr:polyphosphate kinase 2 [Pseudopedobacter sp.]
MKEKKKILHHLYIELVKLQREVISSNLKLFVIIEGRDAAGKDGTIKRIVKHLSPRETIVVALGKPSDRQDSEWYFQRYTAHLPAAGEFVVFNRSWYNRAGVEKVMKFCTQKEYHSFFKEVELFEETLVNAGFIILKYYLDISKKEQEERLEDRHKDPLKQWKISPIDQVATKHWKDYSDARDEMLLNTNFAHSPWYIVKADDKHDTRINVISHLLQNCEYQHKDEKALLHHTDLIYPATTENMVERLF